MVVVKGAGHHAQNDVRAERGSGGSQGVHGMLMKRQKQKAG
jgi:hypothetical protein